MYVPLTPQAAAARSQEMNGPFGGIVALAINGVGIFDSSAGNTDNIFAESGSFDECGGHPDNQGTYHYHSEPYSISYNDSKLIGVMRDGFFIYGRQDADGETPGTIQAQFDGGTGADNLIYTYGGHLGTAPASGDANPFHYHLTEWQGCFDETAGNHGPLTKAGDDGESYDPSGIFDSPAASTCGGQWVDGWFLTGHGNGGVFMNPPVVAGSTQQAPAQTLPSIRYFYGSPGPCANCGG
jgi:hypothetical protein